MIIGCSSLEGFMNEAQTSRYSGSPMPAASLQRSSTAMRFTVLGTTARKCFTLQGLKRRTFSTPTLLPRSFR